MKVIKNEKYKQESTSKKNFLFIFQVDKINNGSWNTWRRMGRRSEFCAVYFFRDHSRNFCKFIPIITLLQFFSISATHNEIWKVWLSFEIQQSQKQQTNEWKSTKNYYFWLAL